jgi:hypothetical protein
MSQLADNGLCRTLVGAGDRLHHCGSNIRHMIMGDVGVGSSASAGSDAHVGSTSAGPHCPRLFIAEYPVGSVRVTLNDSTGPKRVPIEVPKHPWLELQQVVQSDRQSIAELKRPQLEIMIVGALALESEPQRDMIFSKHSGILWPACIDALWQIWHRPVDSFALRIVDRFQYASPISVSYRHTVTDRISMRCP